MVFKVHVKSNMTAVSLSKDTDITAMTSSHVPSSALSAITSHNK